MSDWRSVIRRAAKDSTFRLPPLLVPANKPANAPDALRRHTQVQPDLLLQIADDGEEILRLRIAARAEQADQALGRRAGRRRGKERRTRSAA
jgi:hypothetical protein